MGATRIREFLDREMVRYAVITHSKAFTAQEIAASAHISGKELMKAVVVKWNGKMAMAVLPASHQIAFEELKKLTGADSLQLASEKEFENLFPDCEVGMQSPFGNLYGLEVYVDESVSREKHLVFNAGTYSELIRLEYKDFERLVRPKLGRFSRKA